MIQQHITEFKESGYVPPSLQNSQHDSEYFESRYNASIGWIEENDHAVISNGPFYLDNYSPESRTITIKAFDSDGYPFKAGKWEKFEQVKYPKIVDIKIPDTVTLGELLSITVETENSSTIHYFVSNSKGETVVSGIKSANNNLIEIILTEEDTSRLDVGGNTVKIFVSSDEALRPDGYSTSFIAVEEQTSLPTVPILEAESNVEGVSYPGIASIIIGAIIVGIIVTVRRRRKKS